MIGDLTTVAAVKSYLGTISGANADALLAKLITAASKTILNYVGRQTFAVAPFVDVYDGNGHDFMMLRQWPVTQVIKIELPGGLVLTVPSDCACWPPTNGFLVEDQTSVGGAQQRLVLYGYAFPRGRSNIRVTYDAGYLVSAEAATVPASPFQITPQQTWLADSGVTYANLVALTKVSGVPTVGQYAVDSAGVYTFAAADVGAAVLISYSYVPADVEQAAIQWVGEDYMRRSRLGIISQAVGGQETITYSQKDMSDRVERALNPFKRVTPT